MLNNDVLDFSFVKSSDIFTASITLLGGIAGGLILIFFGGLKLTDTKLFHRLSLQESEKRAEGYTSNFKSVSYVGRKGIAYTVLRPSGKIVIDGEIFDAYTRGDYIDKGASVLVIGEEGTSLKVKVDPDQ
jgi:membrane-bound serine protease (ClpP class)